MFQILFLLQEHRLREELAHGSIEMQALLLQVEISKRELSDESHRAEELQSKLSAELAARAEVDGMVVQLTAQLHAAQGDESNSRTLAEQQVNDLRQQLTTLDDRSASERKAMAEAQEAAGLVAAAESARLGAIIEALEQELEGARSSLRGDAATWEVEKSQLQQAVIKGVEQNRALEAQVAEQQEHTRGLQRELIRSVMGGSPLSLVIYISSY